MSNKLLKNFFISCVQIDMTMRRKMSKDEHESVVDELFDAMKGGNIFKNRRQQPVGISPQQSSNNLNNNNNNNNNNGLSPSNSNNNLNSAGLLGAKRTAPKPPANPPPAVPPLSHPLSQSMLKPGVKRVLPGSPPPPPPSRN
jgi:hypothetical protein